MDRHLGQPRDHDFIRSLAPTVRHLLTLRKYLESIKNVFIFKKIIKYPETFVFSIEIQLIFKIQNLRFKLNKIDKDAIMQKMNESVKNVPKH